MAAKADFQRVFEHLRKILKKFEPQLVVQTDNDETYYLNSKVLGKNKKPICFASTAIKKNYVSYYFMPIYGCKELEKNLSPELKSRMQGKACFNFSAVDAGLFKELAGLTKDGFEIFKRIGYI